VALEVYQAKLHEELTRRSIYMQSGEIREQQLREGETHFDHQRQVIDEQLKTDRPGIIQEAVQSALSTPPGERTMYDRLMLGLHDERISHESVRPGVERREHLSDPRLFTDQILAGRIPPDVDALERVVAEYVVRGMEALVDNPPSGVRLSQAADLLAAATTEVPGFNAENAGIGFLYSGTVAVVAGAWVDQAKQPVGQPVGQTRRSRSTPEEQLLREINGVLDSAEYVVATAVQNGTMLDPIPRFDMDAEDPYGFDAAGRELDAQEAQKAEELPIGGRTEGAGNAHQEFDDTYDADFNGIVRTLDRDFEVAPNSPFNVAVRRIAGESVGRGRYARTHFNMHREAVARRAGVDVVEQTRIISEIRMTPESRWTEADRALLALYHEGYGNAVHPGTFISNYAYYEFAPARMIEALGRGERVDPRDAERVTLAFLHRGFSEIGAAQASTRMLSDATTLMVQATRHVPGFNPVAAGLNTMLEYGIELTAATRVDGSNHETTASTNVHEAAQQAFRLAKETIAHLVVQGRDGLLDTDAG
jgi:hypothetical protein